MAKQIKWDASYKGDGWANRVLEHIYFSKRLSVFGPLAVGAVVLLLFLLYGENPDKMVLLQQALISAVIMFFGALLVLRTQLHNPLISPKCMDWVVLFVTALMGFGAVSSLFEFLRHPKDGFEPGPVVIFAVLSAIALFQTRRK